METSTAAVHIDFYNSAGTLVFGFDVPGGIGANSAKAWYLPTNPDTSGLPSPFIGSAVVSSDKRIAATVNTQLPSGSNPHRMGTSVGVGTAATYQTVYAPQLMRAYYNLNSYCSVQNTGSSAVTVKATYYGSSGAQVATRSQSVPAYSSYIFDQEADTGLPAAQLLSAKFEGDATHPLAVVCNFYNNAADANNMQFNSYNGMGAGGSTLYVPRVVKDYYNYQSGLRVQNIGTVPLSVTVTYNFGGATYTQVSPTFGAGQAWGPYMGAPAQLPSSMASVKGSGSAVISVNNPGTGKSIIAIVNEDNRVDPAGRGSTYEAALAAEGSDTVVFPQITSEYYGLSGGWQVAKVEAGPSTCTAKYSAFGPIAAFSVPFSLTDANPSYSQFAPGASGMLAGKSNDNYSGAVTISCTGAKIVGIANMSFRYDLDTRYGNTGGDTLITVRGIGK